MKQIRTPDMILRDISEVVEEIESTGGALRRLSDLLGELVRSIATGRVPEPPDDDPIVELPRHRERDRA